MGKIFGIDLAGVFNSVLGEHVSSVTLMKVEPTFRTTGALSAGRNPSRREYSAKGLVEDYDHREIDGEYVKAGDRLIMILAASVSVTPEPNDTVTIDGETYRITRVGRDSGGAVYQCNGRRR